MLGLKHLQPAHVFNQLLESSFLHLDRSLGRSQTWLLIQCAGSL
ncbi:hypothetical protein LEMLEM_LOCUS15483 [Lemmus lemmus]